WANQDQYYIKTGENFKDYTFVFDGISVHFRLVDATTEQNNNKESKDSKRTFMLFTEDAEKYPGIKTFEYNPDAAELVIRFVYDIPEDKKRKYAEENYDAIKNWLIALRREELNPLLLTNTANKDTLLEKHLKRYVAKNTFDYFIHKDLRKFLTRELDFFIKSEVMHLEDLDTDNETRVETYLAQVKVIKRVGRIIIDFLAQIEDFQKKLWLKKKFIVATDWCITLDKIDESFWTEIIANKAQLNEWIDLYAIDEADDWTNLPTVDFLRRNKNLIIDTKHFSDAFKYALLETIPNLDEQTNGLMINGDNFHALNLLQSKYREKIKCVYIDPPYNTNAAPILYKDGYKDSSWLCLMEKRLHLSKALSSDDGAIFISIDDNEQANLKLICDDIFGANNFVAQLICKAKLGKVGTTSLISSEHEYITCYAKNISNVKFNMIVNKNEGRKENLRQWGQADRRADRPTMFYPINIDGQEVFPIKDDGTDGRWRVSKETADKLLQNGELELKIKNGVPNIYRNFAADETFMPYGSWLPENISATAKGTVALKSLGLNFAYPKPFELLEFILRLATNKDSIVLDYFAGSGTTGHAVINLNREDGGNRKYILVEMGEYFDTVTKPRMQKVIYSADWKNGKPTNRDKGVSQIIKYMRLESYEDALSNIELSDKGKQWASLFGEDYIIRYMLTMESRDNLLNMENFSNPFAYSMKITEKNECKSRPVDLMETFNYLIGLTVTRQSAIVYYLGKPATNPAYEGALELVNDINGEYAFRQIKGTLPDGRRTLIIWRIVTEDIIASNAALDAYFTTNAGNRKHDVIFVNGDSNLENLRGSHENWSVKMTELEFKKRMFEET
ncbi:MAG: site-specific DNA-methyltransferase, partial [Selenomonadaceae bacterium]|nr:site-specific DNA-methyltransferase [Selenomonadaceae bacterium]